MSPTTTPQQRAEIASSVCVCFLKAAARDSEPARMLLSKVLLSLCMYDDANHSVGRQFTSALPSWVWIQYLPYMVIEFARTGDLTLKALLLRVCAEYPQAIYYHLRDSGLRRKRQQLKDAQGNRSEERTSELQSLMRNSYAVFCLKKTNNRLQNT